MRGSLLASTALAGLALASQPALAFDLTLGGKQEVAVVGDENDRLSTSAGSTDRGYAFATDTEVYINGRDETEGGLEYGFKIELEADQRNTVNADEAGMFFSGAFGRVELGADDGADDVMSLGSLRIAAGTGGSDGDQPGAQQGFEIAVSKIQDTSDAVKITYLTPRLAGFQVGASFTPDSGDGGGFSFSGDNNGDLENHVGVGLNWVGEFGENFDLGLAAVGGFATIESDGGVEPDDDNFTAYSFTGTMGFGNFALGGGYLRDEEGDAERDVIDIGVAYGFGPANVSFTYQNNDDSGIEFDDEANVYIGSADWGILPGVALQTDIQYSDLDENESGWSFIAQSAISF